jgi:hypothetical protein
METLLRSWIVNVLERHERLLAVAVRQRAKFEGWLKFELASHAEENGATHLSVEAASDSGSRSDLSFVYGGERYAVELKTCNTNYRMKGVLDCTRPITKNIDSVIVDGRKLGFGPGRGIVAFCLFPVPCGDNRWTEYLSRIGSGLGLSLTEGHHASRVRLPINDACQADIVVSTFTVAKSAGKIAGA